MRKIFVVEDDQAIREILEVVFSFENYEVQSFSKVSEFAERDTSIHPDLYIFDVMLPDGSGIALCEEIKNNVHNKNVPVIIMSAHAHLKNITITCQPDVFVPKPFDIDQLLVKVRDTVEKNKFIL
jgi:DNA-binding response OmpR family regulator